MKRILHISNWYPNKWDDMEGIFVKEQYKVFSKVTQGHMLNVQVRRGKELCRYEYVQYSDKEKGYYLFTRIKSQKMIELFTAFLLLWALNKSNYKAYSILHFHIAYPLLTYYSWWKKIIKTPILISEHWSAYHFNFYMHWETKKLDRVKNIFKQGIPLITVSKALLEDIQKFSNTKEFPAKIIPNVIDQNSFFYRKNNNNNNVPVFFTVNNWRKIKNPFTMLEGFARLHQNNNSFALFLGGYGEELENMKKFIDQKGFSNKVHLLGKMTKNEIAATLQKSDAYLFSSTYETFCVVCAQALCCGVPLIGPKLLSIEEYADKNSYLPLKKNSVEEWICKIEYFMKNKEIYKREEIAKSANDYLSNDNMAIQYKEILDAWF